MSEELIQRNLIGNPEHMGLWDYYSIGATNLRALKEAGIIPNHDYRQFESKKPDALLTKGQDVIATIEYKTPQELNSKKKIDKAIKEQIGTARALGSRIYIVTDGSKSFWLNPETGNQILQEDGAPVMLNFDKTSRDCIALIGKILSSISASNDRIADRATVDPLPLAQQVWQDLWAVSGATPENCLYTFVEIFIFKYLSDLRVLTGQSSFNALLGLYEENTEDDVLEHYAKIIRPKIKTLFPAGPKDNTTIINGTIFVSKDEKAVEGYSSVFRKILNRFKDFGTLENIDRDFKSRLFETFLKESISKKNWGQYFTPLKVVRAITDMVEIREGMTVCDPACGVGKFLLEPIAGDVRRFFRAEDGRLVPHIALEGFDKGFDREEQKTIILAKANMLIYMADLLRDNPDITRSFADTFNSVFTLQTNSILGTLAHPVRDRYDLVLTNPPYVMSGSSNLKEEIAKDASLRQYFAVNAMGIEGLFMEWIVRSLKPGGKAFVVVPDGIFNRSNDAKLRAFIRQTCFIDAVISLPINTFFTTNKKTYILALTKKAPTSVGGVETLPDQMAPVFTYLCSEIGESRDTYRFDIPQNDLNDAAAQFNMFKGAKKTFRPLSPRCKIMPVSAFASDANWCVDRWWTREEKVALGIEEKSAAVDINGFRAMLSDAASSIAEMDELLADAAEKKKYNDKKRVKRFCIDQLFKIKRGSGRLTRRYVNAHSGDFPVFSGNTFGPFAYIDSYQIDTPCLSWAIDGLAGYVMIHSSKFSATNHRGMLFPKFGELNLRYMKHLLEPLFRAAKKGREGDGGENEYTSLPPHMVKRIEVELPIDENDNIDFDIQNERAAALATVDEVRNAVKQCSEKVRDISVVFDGGSRMATKPLSEFFELKKGLSRYTRKYGQKHKGDYPVYSASSSTPLTCIDTYDYDGRYLTWATNGLAGTMLVLDGRFSLNGDRGLLLPKNGGKDLDLDYMKFTLEPIFRSLAKGRRGDRGEDEFTKLYPSMIGDIPFPIPVTSDGNIDFAAQKNIAAKYRLVEQCKREFGDRCAQLLSQPVE